MAITYVTRFEPTFQAALDIEIVVGDDATRIALPGREPRPLTGSGLDAFVAAMREARPLELGDAVESVRDGIRMHARVTDGATTHELEARSPGRSDHPRHVVFFRAILVAAREAFAFDAKGSRAIDEALKYLR